MAIKTSRTTCMLCKSEYTEKGMTKHLKTCLPKRLDKALNSPTAEHQSFFHILVRGCYLPEYWLHLTVDKNAELEDLDQFLREIWLECCGHLSAFFLKENEIKMSEKVGNILKPGMELQHHYDFGSTTELQVKVLAAYSGPMKNNGSIQILARNEAPAIPCRLCGKAPAAYVCTACQWNGTGWLCQSCAEEHECGDELLLPVLNSPRTGVCGYEG